MPADILIVPNRNSTTLNPNIQFSGSAVNTIRLEAQPSGSVAFVGNSGSLFSVVDSMSGSLMAVSDVSGLPILEVFSDDRVVMGKFNSNALVVTGSRVAIGKATPNATFDVNGNTIVTGSLKTTGYIWAKTGNAYLISSDGITADAGFDVLSNDAYVYAATGKTLSLYTNGTQKVSINTSGDVGIGKSTANAKLDVNGNTIITGSLAITGSDAFIQDGAYRIRVGRGAGTHTWVFTNTALGYSVLQANSSGEYNTGIGWFACGSITSGNNNTVVGGNSGTSISINSGNTFIGAQVSPSGTGGSNTFVGYTAGYEHTTGTFNVFIGQGAGRGITTGGNNVVIGNVTGLASSLSGTIIIADGGGTIRQYIDSSGNMALGKTTPINAKLDVNGNVIVTGSLISVLTGGSSGTNVAIRSTAGNSAGYFGNNQYVMSWDNGTSYSHAIKTRHDASILANNAIDFYIWKAGTDASSAIGTQQMVSILGNGVGINKTSANATLDVNGNAIVTGSLAVTGIVYDSSMSAGTSGQVLSSTGTGTSWVASGTGATPDFSPIFLLMGA